jgi:hypothetical protein
VKKKDQSFKVIVAQLSGQLHSPIAKLPTRVHVLSGDNLLPPTTRAHVLRTKPVRPKADPHIKTVKAKAPPKPKKAKPAPAWEIKPVPTVDEALARMKSKIAMECWLESKVESSMPPLMKIGYFS